MPDLDLDPKSYRRTGERPPDAQDIYLRRRQMREDQDAFRDLVNPTFLARHRTVFTWWGGFAAVWFIAFPQLFLLPPPLAIPDPGLPGWAMLALWLGPVVGFGATVVALALFNE